jgi:hypothetical protein
MAITAETRADIISLVVGMFDAAPSTNLLNDFVNAIAIGQSLEVTASGLAESAEFKSIYADWLTNEEFAAKFVSNILVEASADTVAEAEAFVTGQLNAGADRGEVILSAVEALSAVSADDANYGASAQAHANKVAVATYYSVDMGGNANDLASLQAVLQNVDQNSDVSSSSAIEELINGAEAPSDSVIELTSGTDRLTGTSESDTFEALLAQNSMFGGVSNTLSSADKLDGQGGSDSLHAEIINEFVGVDNDAADIDVQPKTEEIENITFEARDFAGGAGATVTVDAKYMTDVSSIGSKFSDGDLVIENLTTLTASGQIRNTEDITIVMDHTDNFNSDMDASDLTVYFDEDYLISGQIGSSSSIDYRVFNQDAYDLIEEGKDGVELLDGVTFERLNFELNGVTYELAPLIGSDDDTTGTAIRTHEQLVDAMNAAIEQLGLSDKVTAVIGGTFTEETAQGSAGSSRTAPIVRLQGVEGEELTASENLVYLAPSDQNPTTEDGTLVQNSNRYDRAEVSSTEVQDKPITVNVELEKVGRDGEGGNLIIGGKDQNLNGDTDTDQADGISVFNIDVNGTNDQPSNLGFVSSTNQALTTVNIANGDTWDGADLVIRDAFNGATANTANESNVETVNANSFSGDLTIGNVTAMTNVDTFTATGGGAINVTADITGTEKGTFSYTTGGAGDTVMVDLDGDAVDQTGTSFAVSTGAGNDSVTIEMDSIDLATAPDVSFQTMDALDNLTVSTGAGDDTVRLDAYGTFQIDAAGGSDFVIIDGTDENGNATTGMWTFGQDTGAQDFGSRVLYQATLTLTFAGFEQTVTINTTSADNFVATQLTINEAIKEAISQNPELTRLLAVEDDQISATATGSDTSSTGTQELVVRSTVGGLNDLQVSINQPQVVENNATTGQVSLEGADTTALRQGIIDTTALDSDDVNNITEATDGANFGGQVFHGNIGADGVVGATAYSAFSDGGSSDDTAAINFSIVDMGAGANDLVAFHSNDNSANVLKINEAFGKVSVVNFHDVSPNDVTTVAEVGNHAIDFTAYLNNQIDPSSNGTNVQSVQNIAVTLNNTDVSLAGSAAGNSTAEANSVNMLSHNGSGFSTLTAADLVGALNGTSTATVGGIVSTTLSAATTTTNLVGSVQNHIVMVENATNLGEYKVFFLTSTISSGTTNGLFDTASAVELGTLDFGASINFQLVGSTDWTTLIKELTYAADTGEDLPSYDLAASAADVDEGSSVTFTLSTENVAEGDTFDYTITGVDAADVDGDLTGTATIGADGTATVTVALAADLTEEGEETLTLSVAGQSASVTVNDTSVPGSATEVTLNAGTTETTTADAAEDEIFVLDVTAAEGLDDNTVLTISDFDVTADKLKLDVDAAAPGETTVQALVDAGEIVSAQADPFADAVVINFGTDNNGDGIFLTVTGTQDASAIEVTAL